MTVYAITLCYNRSDIVRRSIERFYETRNAALPIVHVLVDQCYPLRPVTVHETISDLGERFGTKLLCPGRNLGLHKGWNYAQERLPIKDDDVLIGYDADAYPLDNGWDMALVTAFQDPKVGWASLWNTASDEEFVTNRKTFRPKKISQVDVRLIDAPVVNGICAWRGSFLRKTGGLSEPTNYYGHLESHMYPELKKQGLEWAVLPGWRECNRLNLEQDREYLLWKWRHAHTQDFPGDFGEFVAAGCPSSS